MLFITGCKNKTVNKEGNVDDNVNEFNISKIEEEHKYIKKTMCTKSHYFNENEWSEVRQTFYTVDGETLYGSSFIVVRRFATNDDLNEAEKEAIDICSLIESKSTDCGILKKDNILLKYEYDFESNDSVKYSTKIKEAQEDGETCMEIIVKK